MRLRSGKKIEEDKEQALKAENKESQPDPVSFRIKVVNMSTLREFAAPNLETQPMSITYAVLVKSLKLNSGFINLLPKFHGLAGENPYRHISKFLITCSAMVPEGIPEEQIRLRVSLFFLLGNAKDWLYYKPAGSFSTWTALHKLFLEKFFSCIPYWIYKERNMWNQTNEWGNFL